jgi:hypothetical protein
MQRVKRPTNPNVVKETLCPDGKRRRFFINGHGSALGRQANGYVQVGGVSVSGYAKKDAMGVWTFYPHFDGKNSHLLRPKVPDVRSLVTIVRGDSAHVGKLGRVVDVAWNHLTPSFDVLLFDGRVRNPVHVVGADAVAKL